MNDTLTDQTTPEDNSGENPNTEGNVMPASKAETASSENVEAVDSEEEDNSPEPAIARPFSLNSFSKSMQFKKEVVESNLTPEELAEKTALYPWYVVHTYSGFEARVKLSLEERIRNEKLQEKFGRIIVPQEQVVELVRGEKKTSSRKFFPGYILIQCDLTDDSWHLVANTPKVTGFVGDTRNPVPLSPQEVQNLFDQMEGGAKKPRPKVQFEDGDSVKVVDGPFADFNGVVDEVKPDKGKLRVLISIFGRNTPVELDFVQVEKV